MNKERSAAITIGGKEYDLVLTTRATKEIAGRYGGLENLGDRLMKSENFEMALDEIIWLITLLANQSVLIHNLQHPEDKKEPLTQDAVELLTSPFELAGYKEAIMEAMYKGTKRNIESETDSKNAEVGYQTPSCLPGFSITAPPSWALPRRKPCSCPLGCCWICGSATSSSSVWRSQSGS